MKHLKCILFVALVSIAIFACSNAENANSHSTMKIKQSYLIRLDSQGYYLTDNYKQTGDGCIRFISDGDSVIVCGSYAIEIKNREKLRIR